MDNLVRVLTTLQSRADSKKSTSQYSWDAISGMMQNITGQKVDYDSFKAAFDSNPELKGLIDNFDDDGIVIKTKEKVKPTVQGQPTDTGAINASAKRAAANTLKRPG